MIETFQEWYKNRHDYARNWKRKHPGKKVVGYLCTYVPEDILYAFDILPVRILGSHEPQNLTEPYIFGMYCPFCRDCLALSLAKDWNVNGAIILQQKFCDPHELDIPGQRKNLEANGIQTLLLELDVTVPAGQFRIRSEAFLEILRQEELF